MMSALGALKPTADRVIGGDIPGGGGGGSSGGKPTTAVAKPVLVAAVRRLGNWTCWAENRSYHCLNLQYRL